MGELGSASADKPSCRGQRIIPHPMYHPRLSSWLYLRVFYIRVSNCQLNKVIPDQLILYHIPLTPDTIIKVNGERSSMYSDYCSSTLRRDRVDKRSEEATFVSTDSISITGNVRLEVYDRDCLLLTGVLELCNSNGLGVETKKHQKNWRINCQFEKPANVGFVKSKKIMNADTKQPMVEVYVAGCFCGAPIILTKTFHFGVLKKHQRKVTLCSIPENETIEPKKEMESMEALQLVEEYQDYKAEPDLDYDYDDDKYTTTEYFEGEDGELSWFNAGVTVGVGIGFGLCVGIGIGVGLLIRTCQATSRNFMRRFI